jgi:hypothetical protein
LLASPANASFDQVGPKQSDHISVEQKYKHIKHDKNNASYEVEMKAEQKRVHSKAYHAARIEAAKMGSDEKAKDLLTQPVSPPLPQQTSPPQHMPHTTTTTSTTTTTTITTTTTTTTNITTFVHA